MFLNEYLSFWKKKSLDVLFFFFPHFAVIDEDVSHLHERLIFHENLHYGTYIETRLKVADRKLH